MSPAQVLPVPARREKELKEPDQNHGLDDDSGDSHRVVSPRKPPFPAKIMKELHEALLNERARIIGELRNLEQRTFSDNGEDSVTNQPGFSAQLADSASENTEIEIALGIRSIEAETLKNIDEALRAIERGDYGYCMGTGKPIELERLRIKPWARYSVSYLRSRENKKP